MYRQGHQATPKVYPQCSDKDVAIDSEIQTLGVRTNSRVVLALQVFKGHLLIHIRKRSAIKDGCEVWTKDGIALHPDEAQKLLELLPRLLELSEHQTIGLPSIDPKSAPASQLVAETRMTLQDRVLMHLAGGSDPEDVRAQVLGNSAESRKRFTELGKALRRCGYLEPHHWNLTPLGNVKARALRGEKSAPVNVEAPELNVEGAPEIASFPGGADLSSLL